jgi:hypothetical protein
LILFFSNLLQCSQVVHICFADYFKVEVLIKLTSLLVFSLKYPIVLAEEKREKGK